MESTRRRNRCSESLIDPGIRFASSGLLLHSTFLVNIPEHRKAIDKLDAQIIKLLNERTQHVLGIGEIKLKAGEEIYAPHREGAVLQRICRLNKGPMTPASLRAI